MEKMDSARVKVMTTARDYVCSDPEVLNLEWNGREIRNCKASSYPNETLRNL